MTDLETRVREKQVERLPISRGEVLLRDLATRYPNLEDDILQEHEARQFTAAPSTSLASSFGGTSLPSAPVELKHSTKSSGRRITTVARSPLLPPASDLIFDMDDLDGNPPVKHVHPERPTYQAMNPWRDANGKPLKEQPPVFKSDQKFRVVPESLSADLNGREAWSEVRPSGQGYVSHPFPSLSCSKRGYATKSVEGTPKRSQVTPSQQSPQSRSTSGLQSPVAPLRSPSLSTPGVSPWKKQDSSPAIPFTTLQKEQTNQALSSTFPPSTQSSLPERQAKSKPILPTRSKIPPSMSTDPSILRRNSATPTSTSTIPTQIRSVPGKSFQQKATPHTPVILETFPILGSSPQNLVDIIAQQTSEQKALSAKATPRSLKEIQEEEEFLQWWEQESLRVKEEEEAIARMTELSMLDGGRERGRAGGGGRGRGMKGRNAKGRGNAGVRGQDFGRGYVHNRGN